MTKQDPAQPRRNDLLTWSRRGAGDWFSNGAPDRREITVYRVLRDGPDRPWRALAPDDTLLDLVYKLEQAKNACQRHYDKMHHGVAMLGVAPAAGTGLMTDVQRVKAAFDQHRDRQEVLGAEVCLVVVGYVSGRAPFRLLGRVSADTGEAALPDPPLTDAEMQPVAFAAKMALAKVLMTRKKKAKHAQ